MSRQVIIIIAVIVLVAGGVGAYFLLRKPPLPPGFAGGNGRLEAKEIYISTKYPGRIRDVLVNEGDMVEAGQVVARMDTSALEAQAQIKQAQDSRDVAQANVRVKQANYDYAARDYARSRELVGKGAVSQQEAEIDYAK